MRIGLKVLEIRHCFFAKTQILDWIHDNAQRRLVSGVGAELLPGGPDPRVATLVATTTQGCGEMPPEKVSGRPLFVRTGVGILH